MRKQQSQLRVWTVWKVLLRLLIGSHWIYFSSQKWFESGWVKPILDNAAETNPIPVTGSLLRDLVIPHWQIITQSQTVIEAIIGILLVIGLLTRIAGTLGAILATSLLLSFLGSLNEPALAWFYILSATMSLTVSLSDAGKTLGLDAQLAHRYPKPRLGFW